MRAGPFGVAVAALIVLGGCGLMGPPGGAGVQSTSCTEFLSGGACNEQTELVASRHPGATRIDLTCTVPVCDRKGGAGSAVVTLANGTSVTETFVYAGNAAPMPVPVCTGLAPALCRSTADAIEGDLPPSKAVVSINLACSIAMCTDAKSETEVRVRFADGTEATWGFGWEGGPP